FQAEDGIRDATVTGVQTCALPIWSAARNGLDIMHSTHDVAGDAVLVMTLLAIIGLAQVLKHPRPSEPLLAPRRARPRLLPLGARSEERRVGSERRRGGMAEEYEQS